MTIYLVHKRTSRACIKFRSSPLEELGDHSPIVTRHPAGGTVPIVWELRRMSESNVEAVVGLVSQAMNEQEGQQANQTFRFHFTCTRHGIPDGRTYFIASHAGHIEGVVGLHHYAWGPPENVWLAWFAVHPRLQSCGLGTLLLEATEEKAHQLGYMKLFIETYSTPDFAKARRFYERHGFVLAGNVNSYLSCGGDMVVYRKELCHAAL